MKPSRLTDNNVIFGVDQAGVIPVHATRRISWGDPDYYWSARSIRAFARDWIGQP